MAETLNLLDQALAIGHEELKHLEAGDVFEAEGNCEKRQQLTDRALQTKDQVSLDDMLDKLDRLRELQGQITAEARKLHSSLKNDLQKAKKQTKRLSAYAGAARGTPIYANRYVNKTG